MANTPRIGLYKPEGTDFVNPVEAISDQMGIIDNSILSTICTSTTRPIAPFNGMEIYETNTNEFRFWTGSAWQKISDGTTTPPATSGNVRGRKGFFIGNWATSFGPNSGQELGPALTAQLNIEKGRRYRFYCGWNVRNLDANDTLPAVLRLRGGEGASVTTSSSLLYSGCSDYFGNSTGFNLSHHLVAHVDIPGSGTTQHTFGIFLFKVTGTSTGRIDWSTADTTYQYIGIEDIGGI